MLKIGTNSLTNNGQFNFERIEELAKEITELQSIGKNIIIISSGAIGIGKTITNNNNKFLQAMIGQHKMMNYYEKCFEKQKLLISQLLITKNDFCSEKQKKHLKEIICLGIKEKMVTIINENDSLSNIENSFGNNDFLASQIANLINADLLIFYSNVNGIYKNGEKKEIIQYAHNEKKLKKFILNEKSTLGSGGMEAKINAAKNFSKNGLTIICHYSKKINSVINSTEKFTTLDL